MIYVYMPLQNPAEAHTQGGKVFVIRIIMLVCALILVVRCVFIGNPLLTALWIIVATVNVVSLVIGGDDDGGDDDGGDDD